jgi:hypothetical protein
MLHAMLSPSPFTLYSDLTVGTGGKTPLPLHVIAMTTGKGGRAPADRSVFAKVGSREPGRKRTHHRHRVHRGESKKKRRAGVPGRASVPASRTLHVIARKISDEASCLVRNRRSNRQGRESQALNKETAAVLPASDDCFVGKKTWPAAMAEPPRNDG